MVLARQREKLKEVETHLKEKDNLLKKEKEAAKMKDMLDLDESLSDYILGF